MEERREPNRLGEGQGRTFKAELVSSGRCSKHRATDLALLLRGLLNVHINAQRDSNLTVYTHSDRITLAEFSDPQVFAQNTQNGGTSLAKMKGQGAAWWWEDLSV